MNNQFGVVAGTVSGIQRTDLLKWKLPKVSAEGADESEQTN